ncbi:MAG: protein-L-isoaspartate O-methyltransferase [Rhizobiales bacterium]|nr:protein-L-isoaspartate O-methyltransferase [Hyphomicrobiales bacterium]
MDYSVLRTTMVDNQLRTNDVTAFDILDRFGEIPRESFLPDAKKPFAYMDDDIQCWSDGSGDTRYMMESVPHARMLQAAKIKPTDLALDIGCGTGYSTAILSGFCESVVAIENNAALVDQATENLLELQIDNAAVLESSLNDGYANEGPYDVIFINGSVDEVSDELLKQLKPTGRLMAFVGHGNAANLTLFRPTSNGSASMPIMNASVPSLPGFERVKEFEF